ncbi:hypothetical protein GJ629_03450 [Halapricum sp. CBA1109]|uniref:hypothetical protein n=1 Tax=Halapricum sp. CBA1109 TaxID=2668068 RepID=UPI0012F96B90|nr:hypothetical protein [Halapricum sp. CBA1109]MUV89071.1 hypothetical protein [Halapricum sp. CBA1109]
MTTKDAPRKKVNFERLEYFSDEDNIEQLLGFVPIDNPETVEGLRQAGIPIGEGDVSTEAVEDINARLNTATQNYNSNGTLITDRETILEFRKRIPDLDLTEDKCELLIWSSLNQRLQGADWIVEYGEGVLDVIRSMIEDPGVKAHTIQRLEITLLAMGESELLEELYEQHSDNGLLKGDLSAECDRSVEDRLGVYGSGNNILFTDSEENMIDLYDQRDDSRLLELLNLCGDMLIDESQSHGQGNPSIATDFRKLELVLIARELS